MRMTRKPFELLPCQGCPFWLCIHNHSSADVMPVWKQCCSDASLALQGRVLANGMVFFSAVRSDSCCCLLSQSAVFFCCLLEMYWQYLVFHWPQGMFHWICWKVSKWKLQRSFTVHKSFSHIFTRLASAFLINLRSWTLWSDARCPKEDTLLASSFLGVGWQGVVNDNIRAWKGLKMDCYTPNMA